MTTFWVIKPTNKIMTNSNVTVAPGGVPNEYEKYSPAKMLNIAVNTAIKSTHLKPLAILIAKAAGRSGLDANARVIQIFCFCPPDNAPIFSCRYSHIPEHF